MAARALARWGLALAILLYGGVASGASQDARDEETLRFVHLEGNVGGASGGHTAVRIGDLVFHYQHDGDVFRLVRDGWPDFERNYAGFQSRPLNLATVWVGAEEATRVRDALAGAHLRQLRRLARREATIRDRRMAEALAGGGDRTYPVPVAGLFDPEGEGDAALAGLRAGLPGVDEQLEAVEARVRGFALPRADEPDALSRLAALRADLALREALRTIARARPLAPDALLDLGLPELTPVERQSLTALARGLGERAGSLLGSRRADRGQVLLRVAARYVAVHRSLAANRPLLLDPRTDAAGARPASEHRPEELRALARQGRGFLAKARSEVFTAAASPAEGDYNRLEDLAGRVASFEEAEVHGGTVEVGRERLVPGRAAPVALPIRAGPHALALALAETARRREARVREEVALRYDYGLIDRNCVTELLAAVQGALGGRERAAQVLGGTLAPGEGLGFIPRVFHQQIVTRYRVTGVERVAPYRERAIEDRAQVAGPRRTQLREANTLTSEVYAPRDADGSFLLFTTGAAWPRPLFGLVNVLYGAGDAALGVFTAPLDGGRRLARAGRGVLFSLPELAFQNVRKGSFDAASLPQVAPAR